MCGIFACFQKENLKYSYEDFIRHNKLLYRRGPDSNGTIKYNYDNNIIYLGHNRLSIQDVSINGSQPMTSYTQRFCIIYNGEIYNHFELRKHIESKINIKWKSNSDTETLVNLFEIYHTKIKTFLNFLEGQFAMAIYDKKLNKLILARDKAGEKPLYISCSNNFIAIASDLKPLSKINNFNSNISQEGLNNFLLYNYISSPLSIFENTFKIPSSSFIEIELNNFNLYNYKFFEQFTKSSGVRYDKWWSLDNYKNEKINTNNLKINYDDSKKLIKTSLLNSVEKQLISDVPLGAFLSGGIDSSLIVSLMTNLNHKPKTFSIGFEYNDFDESVFSKKISDHLNTDHYQHIFTESDSKKIIPNLTEAFSEPFADSSQIPTMLLANFASDHVKVALSGDGGDELFGGYNRYVMGKKFNKYNNLLPNNLKKISLKFFISLPKLIQKNILSIALNLKFSSEFSDSKFEKILNKIVNINNNNDFYKNMISDSSATDLLSFKINLNTKYDSLFDSEYLTFEEVMMHRDFENYLTDDILCKVDRSTMYSSLETRCPFINTDLIEKAYLLPSNFKINNKSSKFILKDILNDFLPQKLFDRNKQGFAVPISRWMKNGLRDWTNDILSDEILNKHNLFDKKNIRNLQLEHNSNHLNHENKLWSLLQFNQWYINFFN